MLHPSSGEFFFFFFLIEIIWCPVSNDYLHQENGLSEWVHEDLCRICGREGKQVNYADVGESRCLLSVEFLLMSGSQMLLIWRPLY